MSQPSARSALAALAQDLQCPERSLQAFTGLSEPQLQQLQTLLRQAQQRHRQQLRSALQQGCPLPLRPVLALLLRRTWP